MDPVLPVFLGIAVRDQVRELRAYLQSNGANLEEEGAADLSENLSEIFSVSSDCINSCNETEVEGFLNSLLSLIFALTEQRDNVICAFVQFLVEMPCHTALRHRLMNVLFSGLNELDPIRYNVYCGQLQLASKSGLIDLITTDIHQVKLWLSHWNDVQKSRRIYRLLHDSFLANAQRENASVMMIELLRTYPVDSGVETRDDAVNCIVSFIDRPNVWIMDHLLELGPVKCLKGELIYQISQVAALMFYHAEAMLSSSSNTVVNIREQQSRAGDAGIFRLIDLTTSRSECLVMA